MPLVGGAVQFCLSRVSHPDSQTEAADHLPSTEPSDMMPSHCLRGDLVKRLLAIPLFFYAMIVPLPAQIVDASVCDILANPPSFDGKMVRVKGTVSAGFDEFSLKDASCSQPLNAI